MSLDIRGLLTPTCELLAFGEPAHREPAFPLVRNELFAQLVERGFRSIAVESDRVAALAVNSFVQDGAGTLDAVMSTGFSHGFGAIDANRRLVAWMRAHNERLPAAERLSFHGFDAPMEQMSPPSPRTYLEHVRDHLGLDVDIAGLAGPDESWSRVDAVLDPALSVGATAAAERLRLIADDMLTTLYARAPEMTSPARWWRAKTHLTAGLGLLCYHRQSARQGEPSARISALAAVRDSLMAQNLLDIRDVEARRGPTMVFAHTMHLHRGISGWSGGDVDMSFYGAGAIVASLVGERYRVVAGSLGASGALGLGAPDPDTYEGLLQGRGAAPTLVPPSEIAGGRSRTDHIMEQGYVPLDRATVAGVDAVLHVDGSRQRAS